MTDSLVAFLRARLDEDEQAALAGGDAMLQWDVAGDSALMQRTGPTHGYDLVPGHVVRSQLGTHNAAHIARHDPARVLAEIDAKRRIMTELEDALADDSQDATHGHMLRCLSLPYADHPDYREEWRP